MTLMSFSLFFVPFIAEPFNNMRSGLDRLRKQLWEDIQKHLAVVLTVSAGYTQMKIDEFLALLDHISKVRRKTNHTKPAMGVAEGFEGFRKKKYQYIDVASEGENELLILPLNESHKCQGGAAGSLSLSHD